MPKKKYIDTSVTLKYWGLLEEYAKINMPEGMNKYLKIKKSYMEKVNELEKQFENVDKENSSEYEERMNALEMQFENDAKEYKGYEKSYYSRLAAVVNFKKKIAAARNKKAVVEKDYTAIAEVLEFVSDDLFDYNGLTVNDSVTTTEALKKLFSNMAKRDYGKIVYGIENPESCSKFEKAMEFEAFQEGAPDRRDVEFMKNILDQLVGGLDRADDNMHINSMEFRAMKKALKDLNNEVTKETVNVLEIGNKLEILQRAAVNYISEKGLGGQRTELGRERFELALNIANFTYSAGEIFKSRDTLERFYISNVNLNKSEMDNSAETLKEGQDKYLKEFEEYNIDMGGDYFISEIKYDEQEEVMEDDDMSLEG